MSVLVLTILTKLIVQIKNRELAISNNKYSIYSTLHFLKIWINKKSTKIHKSKRFLLGEWTTLKTTKEFILNSGMISKTKEFILESGMTSANTFTVIFKDLCFSDMSKTISDIAVKEITRLYLNGRRRYF